MVFNRKPPVRYMRADVRTEFHCRRCGSREWGSRINTDQTLTRSCHGPGCHLQWHESADYQHFSVNGKRLPSRIAFDRAVYTSIPSVVMGQMPPTDPPPEAAE